MAHLDILKDWYNRVWIDGDLDSIDRFFTPDTKAEGMMEFATGPDDLKAVVAAVRSVIGNIEIRFERVVEAENWVWAQMSARATALATEKDLTITGQVMCRFQDGKIVEAYNQIDLLSFFEQLGLLPKHTLALLLAGETLT